jgi:hypothetical protein
MQKRSSKKKPQPDHQQLARKVLDAIAPAPTTDNKPAKNAAAVELGRLGGLKGGDARAKKLTAKQKSAIARKAAKARWANKSED